MLQTGLHQKDLIEVNAKWDVAEAFEKCLGVLESILSSRIVVQLHEAAHATRLCVRQKSIESG
jgi:hypothetical protein